MKAVVQAIGQLFKARPTDCLSYCQRNRTPRRGSGVLQPVAEETDDRLKLVAVVYPCRHITARRTSSSSSEQRFRGGSSPDLSRIECGFLDFPETSNAHGDGGWRTAGQLSFPRPLRRAVLKVALVAVLTVAVVLSLHADRTANEKEISDISEQEMRSNEAPSPLGVNNRKPKSGHRWKNGRRGRKNRLAKEALPPVGHISDVRQDTCPFGHIHGYDGCDASLPCLKKLRVAKSFDNMTPDSLIPQHVWRRIVTTPGDRLDSLHLTLIPFASAMQWKHDVYGTVGQLGGVGFGKFTSLLARTVDVTSGERLFVTDSFSGSSSSSTDTDADAEEVPAGNEKGLSFAGRLSRYELFSAHLREVAGFDEHSGDPGWRLYVFRGQLTELRQRNFAKSPIRDVPQFRIVAVGQDDGETPLTTAVELAVCLLCDGGLLIVDGAGDDPSKLDRFFMEHGRQAIAPLFTAGNKMYLTTTNFRRKYLDYIAEADDWLEIQPNKAALRTASSQWNGMEFLRL